jgi:hypothetical protein
MSATSAASAAPLATAPDRSTSPALLLAGFLLTLAAVFAVAWSVGHGAGPVNPRMHPAPGSGPGPTGGGSGAGGMHGMAGM